MRRILNLNGNLGSVGDFAIVYVTADGRRERGVLIRYAEDDTILVQNSWEGSDYRYRLPQDVQDILNDYSGSWHISAPLDRSVRGILNDCRDKTFRDITIDVSYHPLDDIISARGTSTSSSASTSMNRIIHSSYEDENIYSGFGSYHSTRELTFNQPKKDSKKHNYMIGVELEVEFHSSSNRSKFTATESNYFHCESDGSLGSYGVEIVTIPLLPSDAKSCKTWKPIVDKLLALGATSWDGGRCGLHCHFSRSMFGKDEETQMENITKMCYFYDHLLHDEDFNIKVYGRSSSYSETSGKTRIGEAVKVIGTEVFKSKDVKDRVLKASKDVHDGGRYFDINTRNRETIEFRKGRGSININRILAIIEYNELIAKFAIKTKCKDMTLANFKSFISENISDTSPLNLYFNGDV